MTKQLACALLVLTASSATAQETADTFMLKELVVSVARVPTERATASAAISVLTSAELRTRGIRTVAEALRTIPGTAIAQGGSYGAFGSLFMRGGESDYVQVLLDGVRINSPGEHFDFGNMTLENIERIEVVRGPVSVLYGSDAVTGVVQLFTKPGTTQTAFDAAAAGGMGRRHNAADGSFGSATFQAQLRGSVRGAGYSVGAAYFQSDGAAAFNNQNRNSGVTARMSLPAGARTNLSGTARYTTNTFHYPTDGAGNVVDANQQDVAATVAAGIEVAHRLSGKLEARALFSLDRNTDVYTDDPDNAADTLGFYAYRSSERFQHESVDVRFNYVPARRATLTLGAEYDRQHERGWSASQSEYGPASGSSREARSNRALYGQVLAGARALNVQLGARLDDNQRFGTFGTYRGGASLRLSPYLRVRASAGTGFKQPRFYEQFATGFVRGNPALAPERSLSFEGGAEFTAAAWRIGMTRFGQRFRDLIQYIGMPAHADDPNYLNLGAARANGWEIEAERSAGALTLRASYTRLHTRVTDAGVGDDPLFVAGSDLIRRPRHAAALATTYARSEWSISAIATYTGRRSDLDFRTYPFARVQLPSFTRVDLAAERALGRSDLRATLQVENAFNAAYQEAFNFPARGRVVFAGFRYVR